MAFDIRVGIFDPVTKVRLRTLYNYSNLAVGMVLNDHGSMSFDMNQQFALDQIPELYNTFVECNIEYSNDLVTWTEPINGRFIRTGWSTNSAKIESDGTHNFVTTSWLLSEATVELNGGNMTEGVRQWGAATAGSIMKAMIDECHFAGVIGGLDYDFNADVDSNGVPWANRINVPYGPSDLFTILQDLVDKGMCDWCMQGRVLRVFNQGQGLAIDKSATAVWRIGHEITDAPNNYQLSMISRTIVFGAIQVFVNSPAANDSPWGKFSQQVDAADISDVPTLQQIGAANNAVNRGVAVQHTRTLNAQIMTGNYPLDQIKLGYYVSLRSDPAAPLAAYRVLQYTVTKSDTGEVTVTAILNDRHVNAELYYQRQFNRLRSNLKPK